MCWSQINLWIMPISDSRGCTVRVTAHVRHSHRHCGPHSYAGRGRCCALHYGTTQHQDSLQFGQLHLQWTVHKHRILAQQLSSAAAKNSKKNIFYPKLQKGNTQSVLKLNKIYNYIYNTHTHTRIVQDVDEMNPEWDTRAASGSQNVSWRNLGAF